MLGDDYAIREDATPCSVVMLHISQRLSVCLSVTREPQRAQLNTTQSLHARPKLLERED